MYKKIHIIFLLFITALGFWSCTGEEIGGKNGNTELGNEVEMTFRLSVPDPETKASATRAQTEEETKLLTADVLVFTQTGGSSQPFTYAYRVKGGVTSSGNPVSGFTARLKTSSVPVKIFLLANASVPEQVAEPAVGATEETVRNELSIATQPGTMSAGGIPMWGEYTFPAGLSPEYSREVNGIAMYRAMAKVTVTVDPAFASRFQVTSLYAVRSRTRVALIPKSTDGSGLVTDVRIPVDAGLSPLAPIGIQPASASFYLAEDAGWGTAQQMASGTGSDKNTCIIIGGRLDGGTETFYRLDTQHGPKDQEIYGRVVRNNHYRIMVTGIERPGKASLALALAEGLPTLLYKSYFTPYDLGLGLKTIVFDGIEQLSAAEKQIVLLPDAGTRDIPISPGAINTGVQIARYSAGAVVGAFGQTATLTGINGTAAIAMSSGNPVLRITSQQNAGTTDLTDQIILKTPTKVLLLDVVKKSPNTIGIAAMVDGAVTNPQRAEFMAEGGTKTITVTSTTGWQVKGMPDWIRARKTADNKLEITVLRKDLYTAREHIFSIENQLGQSAQITVYQQYNLEWSAAYSRGGEHITADIAFRATASSLLFYFYPATPAGTPIGFGAPVGDVGILVLKTSNFVSTGYEIHPYISGNTVWIPENPPNQDMTGDHYTLQQLKQACPPGWRPPTLQEAETLAANMQWSGKTNYITQNGVNIYFPAFDVCWTGASLAISNVNNSNVGFYIGKAIGLDKKSFYIHVLTNFDRYAAAVRCVR